jgi:hypothetical protein
MFLPFFLFESSSESRCIFFAVLFLFPFFKSKEEKMMMDLRMETGAK